MLPGDAVDRLQNLRRIWGEVRGSLVMAARDAPGKAPFVGLPDDVRPASAPSESHVEQVWIRRVLEDVLGFDLANNQTFASLDITASRDAADRPDFFVFARRDHRRDNALNLATLAKNAGKPLILSAFSKSSDYLLGAKSFDKKTEHAADIAQVRRYSHRSNRSWGVLTNGASWRLMRCDTADRLAHLRFDLVLFLEELGDREPSEADLSTFNLFWHLFSPPAVGGGWLDRVMSESEASLRKLRETLRDNAHAAVTALVNGFLSHPDNPEWYGFASAADLPPQQRLDHLRELALIYLYRLLFVLKAEAQNLLPMKDEFGAATRYANHISTATIHRTLTHHE